ncbi:ezrin, partial [Austrofundulus limnaeus]|uniref:Ezrin n=1 Tax=Austrofundulus limnaeus TaxID=52670 RepID=A0A2I4AHR0_AUSLI
MADDQNPTSPPPVTKLEQTTVATPGGRRMVVCGVSEALEVLTKPTAPGFLEHADKWDIDTLNDQLTLIANEVERKEKPKNNPERLTRIACLLRVRLGRESVVVRNLHKQLQAERDANKNRDDTLATADADEIRELREENSSLRERIEKEAEQCENLRSDLDLASYGLQQAKNELENQMHMNAIKNLELQIAQNELQQKKEELKQMSEILQKERDAHAEFQAKIQEYTKSLELQAPTLRGQQAQTGGFQAASTPRTDPPPLPPIIHTGSQDPGDQEEDLEDFPPPPPPVFEDQTDPPQLGKQRESVSEGRSRYHRPPSDR